MSDLNATMEEQGPDLLHELGSLQSKLRQGFPEVMEAWGKEVVLPYIAANWPREGWPPLAPSTKREKRRRGFPETALIRSGALFEAATQVGAPGNIFEAGPFSLVFGVSGEIEYAHYQYFGTFRIPARPWDEIEGEPMAELERRLGAVIEGLVLD